MRKHNKHFSYIQKWKVLPHCAILYIALILATTLVSCGTTSGIGKPSLIPPSPESTEGTGAIRGTIWHDLCVFSGAKIHQDPLPNGCIPNKFEHAIGNGVREAEEPGILGVQVMLYKDNCNNTPFAISVTDGHGDYTFSGLLDGNYCVSIESNTLPNNKILMSGEWSHPKPSTDTIVQLFGTVTDGGVLVLDFGWDYLLQPLNEMDAIIATQISMDTPTFIVDTPVNCFSGPSTDYKIVIPFPRETLHLVGRNLDNSWWNVQMGKTQNCWISNKAGHILGSIDTLPIVPIPPTPAGDVTPPIFSDATNVTTFLSYPSTSCGANEILLTIRVSDSESGVDSIWLRYRFHNSNGFPAGDWHVVSPNKNISDGQQEFRYSITTEAVSELGTSNGHLLYQFLAKDKAGNTDSYPNGANGDFLGIPIQYCP